MVPLAVRDAGPIVGIGLEWLIPQAASGAEMGWLEGQPLAPLRQGGLNLPQGGASAGGDHQFGGLITEDAAVAANRQGLAAYRPPQPGLGTTALDAQGTALGLGRRHLRRQRLGKVLIHASPLSGMPLLGFVIALKTVVDRET